MSQVRLKDEEIQKLIEFIQAGAEVPEDLLPKLSSGFFENHEQQENLTIRNRINKNSDP